MLTTKLFEVRARHTLIAVMATRLYSDNAAERFLLGRSGFADVGGPYVILTQLDPVKASYDPFSWGVGSTLSEAHYYIREHFDKLESGQVVDVDFINGRSALPRESEAP